MAEPATSPAGTPPEGGTPPPPGHVEKAIADTAAKAAAAAVVPPAGVPTPPAPAATPPAVLPPQAPEGGDAGDFNLTRDQFNERIGKAKTAAQREAQKEQAAFFKEHYGTEDAAEVQKIIASRKQAASDHEKRQRAEMSDLEKANVDLAREKGLREQWETKYKQSQSDMLYAKQDNVVAGIMAEHVAPKFFKHARRELAEHLRDVVGTERAGKWTDKDIKQFFGKTLLKEYPEYAVKVDETKPTVVKQKLTTGISPNQAKPKPNADNSTAGKDVRPGRPNSMTRSEARAHARKLGFSY